VPFEDLMGIGHTEGAVSLFDTPHLIQEWGLPTLVVLLGRHRGRSPYLLERTRSFGCLHAIGWKAPVPTERSWLATWPAKRSRSPRSTGQTGGDQQANRPLHEVTTRMGYDTDSRAYLQCRTVEGLSKKESVRCLKRYVAREVCKILTSPETRNQDLTQAA
jgi:hypothetical protein